MKSSDLSSARDTHIARVIIVLLLPYYIGDCNIANYNILTIC